MLQHVEADDRVESPFEPSEIFRRCQVAARYRHIGTVLKPHSQAAEVLIVDVAGYIFPPPRRQMLAQVADAGPDLEHARSHPRPHGAGHPAVEVRRLRQSIQNARPLSK